MQPPGSRTFHSAALYRADLYLNHERYVIDVAGASPLGCDAVSTGKYPRVGVL
jgi:hypothetical protein